MTLVAALELLLLLVAAMHSDAAAVPPVSVMREPISCRHLVAARAHRRRAAIHLDRALGT